MGLFDDDDFELDELLESVKKYPSCVVDLNEGEVQAIFDRCLAKDGTPREEITFSLLFSRTMGYLPEDEHMLIFNKGAILANKKIICYLFGQLKNAHTENEALLLTDAHITYKSVPWTNNKGRVLELLYLGCTNEANMISLFDAKTDSANLNFPHVKPTLSPKDPAFPEWWEQHKAEWEG